MTKKAVVLVSGGLDSATTLAMARAQDYECYALSFDYGQRHRCELAASDAVSEHLGNTPAVARTAYVHPRIVEAYLQGDDLPAPVLDDDAQADADMIAWEQALLELLEDE